LLTKIAGSESGFVSQRYGSGSVPKCHRSAILLERQLICHLIFKNSHSKYIPYAVQVMSLIDIFGFAADSYLSSETGAKSSFKIDTRSLFTEIIELFLT
jgi:hypothetical protein